MREVTRQQLSKRLNQQMKTNRTRKTYQLLAAAARTVEQKHKVNLLHENGLRLASSEQTKVLNGM